MAHRHFFRVSDPTATAEYEAAPWVYRVEWERRYADSGIISEETSPDLPDAATAHRYIAAVKQRPDFIRVVNGPFSAKPDHLSERMVRRSICHAEAAAALGAAWFAPPVVEF